MCNDMSREKRRCVLTAGEIYVMKKNDRLHEADGRSEK